MAQITTGIRAALSLPWVYDSFQRIAGVRRSRTILVSEHIRPRPGDRVLDIGCGTGTLLEYLPETVEYVGFDASAEYIEAARHRFGNRGQFVNQLLDQTAVEELHGFDRVTATGILHHLDDDEVLHLFRVAKGAMVDDGEFHSLDPCFCVNQSAISRFLVSRDRGQNVREPAAYRDLALRVFNRVELTHRNDMRTIPYDNAILRCY